jgi:hypothetical protein
MLTAISSSSRNNLHGTITITCKFVIFILYHYNRMAGIHISILKMQEASQEWMWTVSFIDCLITPARLQTTTNNTSIAPLSTLILCLKLSKLLLYSNSLSADKRNETRPTSCPLQLLIWEREILFFLTRRSTVLPYHVHYAKLLNYQFHPARIASDSWTRTKYQQAVG